MARPQLTDSHLLKDLVLDTCSAGLPPYFELERENTSAFGTHERESLCIGVKGTCDNMDVAL